MTYLDLVKFSLDNGSPFKCQLILLKSLLNIVQYLLHPNLRLKSFPGDWAPLCKQMNKSLVNRQWNCGPIQLFIKRLEINKGKEMLNRLKL